MRWGAAGFLHLEARGLQDLNDEVDPGRRPRRVLSAWLCAHVVEVAPRGPGAGFPRERKIVRPMVLKT